MAGWSAVPSCTNLQLKTSSFHAGGFVHAKVHCGIPKGKCDSREWRISVHLQTWVVHMPRGQVCTAVTRKKHLVHRDMQCRCMGNLIDQNMSMLNWVSAVDQVLLVVSTAFAYTAGAFHLTKPSALTKRKTREISDIDQPTTTSGSTMKGWNQSNILGVWDEVQKKLVDALESSENDFTLNNEAAKCENGIKQHPLSLHAIAVGPRLRLLQTTLVHLHKEVENISESSVVYDRVEWPVGVSGRIRASVRPICMTWLQEEMPLGNKIHQKVVLTGVFKKLEGDDSILWSLSKSGKEGLYADLFFFLRFGSVRCGGYYDSQFLAEHGVDILEDLLVGLADRIANIYLELVSVDSSVSSEMNSMALVQCSLSTREVQKLRNEVALSSWLYENIEAVVSMYEDRFDLFTLRKESVDKTSETFSKKSSWWMNLILRKSASSLSTSHYIAISKLSLPVKRVKELRALTGWLYYFSLYLELFDIAMPFIKVVFERLSSAISFFLVCLIGRSLGLIYRGIRQSLSWK